MLVVMSAHILSVQEQRNWSLLVHRAKVHSSIAANVKKHLTLPTFHSR